MNLVETARRTGMGALAGALVAYVLMGLGAGDVLGNLDLTFAVSIGLAAGAAIGALRRERWLWGFAAILLAVHLVIANTPIMSRVAAGWVRDDGPPAPQDAIVVLSGNLQTDSAMNAIATERLLSGMALFRVGVAPRLVTTRIEIDDSGVRRTSTLDQRRLLTLAGITTAWTEVTGEIQSTRDEAVRSAAQLLPMGVRRIALVTSPFHTRRACATFEAVGFTVSCYPSVERQMPTRRPINSAERVAAFGDYVYERLGMVKYRWRGWLDARRTGDDPPGGRR